MYQDTSNIVFGIELIFFGIQLSHRRTSRASYTNKTWGFISEVVLSALGMQSLWRVEVVAVVCLAPHWRTHTHACVYV